MWRILSTPPTGVVQWVDCEFWILEVETFLFLLSPHLHSSYLCILIPPLFLSLHPHTSTLLVSCFPHLHTSCFLHPHTSILLVSRTCSSTLPLILFLTCPNFLFLASPHLHSSCFYISPPPLFCFVFLHLHTSSCVHSFNLLVSASPYLYYILLVSCVFSFPYHLFIVFPHLYSSCTYLQIHISTPPLFLILAF